MPIKYCSKISAIIFDLDGTLIPTRMADLITSYKCAAWMTLHGVSLAESRKCVDDFLLKFRERPSPEGIGLLSELDEWRQHLWESVLPVTFKASDALYEFWKQERCRQLSLAPAIQTMLKKLHLKYQLLLLTNGPSVAQWEKINNAGLQNFMDYFIVSEDVGLAKPEAEIFDIACDLLKVSPDKCVMVGDKLETDVEGAQNAHYGATIWISPFDRSSPNCNDNSKVIPDYIINNILQLENVLDIL